MLLFWVYFPSTFQLLSEPPMPTSIFLLRYLFLLNSFRQLEQLYPANPEQRSDCIRKERGSFMLAMIRSRLFCTINVQWFHDWRGLFSLLQTGHRAAVGLSDLGHRHQQAEWVFDPSEISPWQSGFEAGGCTRQTFYASGNFKNYFSITVFYSFFKSQYLLVYVRIAYDSVSGHQCLLTYHHKHFAAATWYVRQM